MSASAGAGRVAAAGSVPGEAVAVESVAGEPGPGETVAGASVAPVGSTEPVRPSGEAAAGEASVIGAGDGTTAGCGWSAGLAVGCAVGLGVTGLPCSTGVPGEGSTTKGAGTVVVNAGFTSGGLKTDK